jgi:hypothetical protein
MLTPFLVFIEPDIRDQSLYYLIMISSIANIWNKTLFTVGINLTIDPKIKAQISEPLHAPSLLPSL